MSIYHADLRSGVPCFYVVSAPFTVSIQLIFNIVFLHDLVKSICLPCLIHSCRTVALWKIIGTGQIVKDPPPIKTFDLGRTKKCTLLRSYIVVFLHSRLDIKNPNILSYYTCAKTYLQIFITLLDFIDSLCLLCTDLY